MNSSDSDSDESLVALTDMSILELIEYSNKSEQNMNEVRDMTPKRDVRFEVFAYGITIIQDSDNEYEVFSLPFSDMPKYGQLYEISFNGQLVIGGYGKHDLSLFHENVTGFQSIANCLFPLFDNPVIASMKIEKESVRDRHVMIDWIKNHGSPVCFLEIIYQADVKSDNDLSYILDNINISTAIGIHNNLKNISNEFRHSLPPLLKHLSCYNSKWITLNQLVTPHFEFIYLTRTQFTNQQMVWYVEMCLGGEMPGLVYFEVDVEEMSIEKIANGVGARKMTSNVHTLMKCEQYTEQNIVIRGHYDFKRKDGMIVTIGERFGGNAEPNFQMFIWAEYDVRI